MGCGDYVAEFKMSRNTERGRRLGLRWLVLATGPSWTGATDKRDPPFTDLLPRAEP